MRKIGDKDLSPRKLRSDIGKKRKKYRGHKIKTKRRIRFEKREGKKTAIKLRIFEKKPMSIEGWRNWNKKIRPKIRPYVYMMGAVIITPVADISNKEDFENWALDAIGYPGDFYIMGLSGSLKSSFRVKWVKMCRIVITDAPEGMRSKMVQSINLYRYKWFYKE